MRGKEGRECVRGKSDVAKLKHMLARQVAQPREETMRKTEHVCLGNSS